MYITDIEQDVPAKYQATMQTPTMMNADISSFFHQLTMQPFLPTTSAILCQCICAIAMLIANAIIRV